MDARLPAVKILGKLLKWASALVELAFDAGIEVLRFGDAFRTIEPAFADVCRMIAPGGSGEDIQVDRKRVVAYLALLDRDSVRRDLGKIHCRPLAQ